MPSGQTRKAALAAAILAKESLRGVRRGVARILVLQLNDGTWFVDWTRIPVEEYLDILETNNARIGVCGGIDRVVRIELAKVEVPRAVPVATTNSNANNDNNNNKPVTDKPAPPVPSFTEQVNRIVVGMMHQHGVHNVRGGSFSTHCLTWKQRDEINDRLVMKQYRLMTDLLTSGNHDESS